MYVLYVCMYEYVIIHMYESYPFITHHKVRLTLLGSYWYVLHY